MDVPQEITKRVQVLPAELQDQVLRFIDALSQAPAAGLPSVELLPFAATLDPESARQMSEAIEEECEQIDPGDW